MNASRFATMVCHWPLALPALPLVLGKQKLPAKPSEWSLQVLCILGSCITFQVCELASFVRQYGLRYPLSSGCASLALSCPQTARLPHSVRRRWLLCRWYLCPGQNCCRWAICWYLVAVQRRGRSCGSRPPHKNVCGRPPKAHRAQ